jgi:predicted RNA-binding Zn-ribbon protein involved in translation (DUF1610 family)
MDISTKFNLGDTVYVIYKHRPDIPCPACGGEKVLHGKDGVSYPCSNCDEHGVVCPKEEWVVSEQEVISYIELRLSSTIVITKYSSSETWGSFDDYTCFPTKEEAQAEADRRNKEDNNG